MHTNLMIEVTPCGPMQESPELYTAVILYDEAASGRRAMQTLGTVTDALDGSAAIDVRLWRFDVLATPSLRHAAANDLLKATIIILSARAASRLPEHEREWLARIAEQRRDDVGLVMVLLADKSEFSSSLGGCLATLRQAAEPAGLDLLGSRAGQRSADGSFDTFRRICPSQL